MKTRTRGRVYVPVLTYALDQGEHSVCFNPEKEISIHYVVPRAYVNLLLPETNRIMASTMRKLLYQLSHSKNSLPFPVTWRRKRKEFSKRSSLQKKKRGDICHCPKFHFEKLLLFFLRIMY